MERQEILSKYSEKQDKILVSQIIDRINISAKRNRIEVTDFLDERQKQIAEEVLNLLNIKNYIFDGGYEEAERKLLIIYPDKFNVDIVRKNIDNYVQVIRILLPEELHSKYTHRDYLGGVIKIGIEREKVGDIIVTEDGADIIIKRESADFLYKNISTLTRFNKSNISIIKTEDLKIVEIKKQEIQIIVSSLRLDNVLSEMIKTSRSKATEYIINERVFVNHKCETKKTKILKLGDVISVRGKGRFVIKEFISKTKSGRDVITIQKYT